MLPFVLNHLLASLDYSLRHVGVKKTRQRKTWSNTICEAKIGKWSVAENVT